MGEDRPVVARDGGSVRKAADDGETIERCWKKSCGFCARVRLRRTCQRSIPAPAPAGDGCAAGKSKAYGSGGASLPGAPRSDLALPAVWLGGLSPSPESPAPGRAAAAACGSPALPSVSSATPSAAGSRGWEEVAQHCPASSLPWGLALTWNREEFDATGTSHGLGVQGHELQNLARHICAHGKTKRAGFFG